MSQVEEGLWVPGAAEPLQIASPEQRQEEETELEGEEREEAMTRVARAVSTVSMEQLVARRIKLRKVDWTVEQLAMSRDTFVQGDYQRGYVWSRDTASVYILSLLYGFPAPPIHVLDVKNQQTRRTEYEILDGVQRMNTIWLFKEGKIRTPTPEQVVRVNPNARMATFDKPLTYGQLSGELQSLFNEIEVSFVHLVVPPELVPTLFVNFNNGQELEVGQRIKAYDTVASQCVMELQDWSLWSSIYVRRTKSQLIDDLKRERVVAAMQLFILQTAKERHYIADARIDQIEKWGGGHFDRLITSEVISEVHRRLGVISHVFADANLRKRSPLIIMFQAVAFLEELGLDLMQLPRGALTPWFLRMHKTSHPQEFSAISHTADMLCQVNFWNRQLSSLYFREVPQVAGAQYDLVCPGQVKAEGDIPVFHVPTRR